jgi:rhomboid protease GluP
MPPKIPRVTVCLLGITAIVTGLQFFSPGIIACLQRTPGVFSAGQWWRLITPIFINPESWRQITFNFLSIAIVGTIVEKLFGGCRWLILYFVGGLVGELAGFAW